MSANPKHFLTPDEYLEIDRASEERHEYLDGEIFLMSGGSPRHNTIIFNINGALHRQLRGTRCRGYSNSQRVVIEATGLRTFPDVVIVCGDPVFVKGDTLTNPTLIVEVLSPSTEDYDKNKKFDHYRRIPTLAEYLIVAQDRPHIERRERRTGGWWVEHYESLIDVIELPSVGCRLAAGDAYENIEFAEEQEETIDV